MKIEVLDQAENDLFDGASFYQSQHAGLGQYFLDSLFSDIESLQLYGGVHAKVFGYHRLLSRRFPYAIYYRMDEDTIWIHAVLDCRNSPRRAQARLLDP